VIVGVGVKPGIAVELGVGVALTVPMAVPLGLGVGDRLNVGIAVGISPVRMSRRCSAMVRISGSGICSSKIQW
jgi:hypothetical protein